MRLYLAGLEGANNKNEYQLDLSPDNLVLTSFYYCTDKVITWLIDNIGVDNILLDSGAFTFIMHGLKGVDIDEYIDNYIKFINKYDIKYFFEMDIDRNFDELAKVKEYRKRIEQGTGKKCIPVWHKTRGIDEWRDIVDNYDYIAIGGITSGVDKNYASIIKNMVKYANSHKTKVHGLGYNKKDLLDFGFYSCDATTWNGGAYGKIFEFKRSVGYPVGTQSVQMGKRMRTEVQPAVFKHNFKVWSTYQKYLRNKGVWRD